MFFNKTSSTNTPVICRNISVLGSGTTALYLAGLFQNIGHNVNIICPPSTHRQQIDITIKNSAKLSSSHYKICTSYELITSPDFLFIASELPDLYSDLLLISPSKLSDTTIINLTPCSSPDFISHSLKQQAIPAYLYTWLSQNGNTISSNTSSPQITFTLSPDSSEAVRIKDIFQNNDMDLVFRDSPADNLWNWLAPIVLSYFICNTLKSNIKELSKSLDGRNILDNCINEISQLALLECVSIDRSNLLSSLYNAPTNLFSTKDCPPSYTQRFSAKIKTLLFSGVSTEDKRFPTLKKLINKSINIS